MTHKQRVINAMLEIINAMKQKEARDKIIKKNMAFLGECAKRSKKI